MNRRVSFRMQIKLINFVENISFGLNENDQKQTYHCIRISNQRSNRILHFTSGRIHFQNYVWNKKKIISILWMVDVFICSNIFGFNSFKFLLFDFYS